MVIMRKIVLVEDQPMIAKTTASNLARLGYVVETATSGQSAIQMVHDNEDIDLVLMDLELDPEMDGVEAANRILQDHDIPIIFLTGFEDEQAVNRINRVQRYGLVNKMASIFVLKSTIDLALQLYETQKGLQLQSRILDSIGQAVIVIKRDGTITFWGKFASTLFGWSSKEAVGMNISKILYSNSGIPFNSSAASLQIKQNGRLIDEYVAQCSNEETVSLLVTGNPRYKSDGTIQSIILVCTDLRERQQMEQERLELQNQISQMDKISTLGQTLSGLGHEINNILGIIKTSADFIQLLHSSGKEQFSEEVIRDLSIISSKAKHGSDIIFQLMNMAKPTELVKEPVKISRIIDDIIALVKYQCNNDSIDIILEMDADSLIIVDKGQVSQVLLNLINNARHAILLTGKSGIITISVSLQIGSISISIQDNGIGIPEKIQEMVFKPFFTTKKSGSNNGQNVTGSGLGLAISRRIIKNHGGSLTFVSTEGVGTTFLVTLPTEAETKHLVPDVNSKKPELVAGASDLHFAIVDDVLEFTELLTKILKGLGIKKITSYTNPVEFLRDDCKPDILLVDLFMPGLTGGDIISELKKKESSARIIAVSGISDSKVTDKMLGGDIPLLSKPFSIDDVVSTINDLLNRGS
jgi:PAS domain S-box-containing protein